MDYELPGQVLADLRLKMDGEVRRIRDYELPGEVLTDLRYSTGRGRKEFAQLTGFSYSTQRRLELGLQAFRHTHLEAYRLAGWYEAGDKWYTRLERAIAAQWSAGDGNGRLRGGLRREMARVNLPAQCCALEVGAPGWVSGLLAGTNDDAAGHHAHADEGQPSPTDGTGARVPGENNWETAAVTAALSEITRILAGAGVDVAAIVVASPPATYQSSGSPG